MPKKVFDKSARKNPKPISKTEISKPQETYNPSKVVANIASEQQVISKVRRPGRPKSGRKQYQTVRLLKSTVLKVNALEKALGIPTQDATIDQAIDRLLRSLTNDEMRGYKLWLDMYKKKSNQS